MLSTLSHSHSTHKTAHRHNNSGSSSSAFQNQHNTIIWNRLLFSWGNAPCAWCSRDEKAINDCVIIFHCSIIIGVRTLALVNVDKKIICLYFMCTLRMGRWVCTLNGSFVYDNHVPRSVLHLYCCLCRSHTPQPKTTSSSAFLFSLFAYTFPLLSLHAPNYSMIYHMKFYRNSRISRGWHNSHQLKWHQPNTRYRVRWVYCLCTVKISRHFGGIATSEI